MLPSGGQAVLRTFITCVGFSDFLSLTLPYNKHHWQETYVLTTPDDKETQRVARENRASVYATNSFFKGGAKFNKFVALEECLTHFGRRGIMALVDADIFWPTGMSFTRWQRGFLYSFRRRRLLLDVTAPIPPESEWSKLPLDPQHGECLGYSQIFHADDPVLLNKGIPWHPTHLSHAGLGDSHFQFMWPMRQKVWLDFDVLHLGDYANNWVGRVVKHRDGSTPEGGEQRAKDVEELKNQLWPKKPGKVIGPGNPHEKKNW